MGMDFASVKGTIFQAEFHIFSHAHVGKNRIILEYHADIPLGRVQVIDPRGIKIEIPALNGVESRNHAQKRSLAASGRAENRIHFPGFHLSVNSSEYLFRFIIGIFHIL